MCAIPVRTEPLVATAPNEKRPNVGVGLTVPDSDGHGIDRVQLNAHVPRRHMLCINPKQASHDGFSRPDEVAHVRGMQMNRILEVLEPLRMNSAKIARVDLDPDQHRWSRLSFWARVKNEIVVTIGSVVIPSQSTLKRYRSSI